VKRRAFLAALAVASELRGQPRPPKMHRRAFPAALALAPGAARRFFCLRYDAVRVFCVEPLPGADPPRGPALPESDRDELTIADFFAVPPPSGPYGMERGEPVTVAGTGRLFDFHVERLVSVDDCGRAHSGALLRIDEPHAAAWQAAGESVTLAWRGRGPAGWRAAGSVAELPVAPAFSRRLERHFRSAGPAPAGRLHASIHLVPLGPDERLWSVRAGWAAEGEEEPSAGWHAWLKPDANTMPALPAAQPFNRLPEPLGVCLFDAVPHVILRTRGVEDLIYRLWARRRGRWESANVEYTTGC
jgi:hypothetical protein